MTIGMARWFFLFVLGLLGSVLTACGPHYPLGIPEERWATMSPSERLQAREKQAEVDRARAEARRKEAEARLAQAKAREAELAHARATAPPGQRVQCVLDPVEIKAGKDWVPAQPVALDLVAGMPIDFTVQARGKHYRTERGTARFDGMTVELCERYRDRDCARFVGTTHEFRHGKRGRIHARDFLRGQMRCSLAGRW